MKYIEIFTSLTNLIIAIYELCIRATAIVDASEMSAIMALLALNWAI